MIRILPALYQVLASPLNFVKFYCFQSPLRLGFLCLTLVTIAKLPNWVDEDLSFIMSFILVFAGYCILLGLQAMATDFFAQLLHFNGKSLSLFAWFNVSLLPFILEPVFYLLSRHMLEGKFFINLGTLLGVVVMAWQIYMVKQVYQSSLSKSLLLYVLPLLFLLGLALLVGLLGAAVFSFYE